jgi:hypothetical protein
MLVPTGAADMVARMSESTGAAAEANTLKVSITGPGVKIDQQVDAERLPELLSVIMAAESATSPRAKARRSRVTAKAAKSKSGNGVKPAKRKPSTLGTISNLSMRPKGKKSFEDFATEKAPSNAQARGLVAAYWLAHDGGVASGITVDHVNTCFLAAKWQRPANLANVLQIAATRKRWFDTSDMSNIKLTSLGEDEVQFNMPAKKK